MAGLVADAWRANRVQDRCFPPEAGKSQARLHGCMVAVLVAVTWRAGWRPSAGPLA